MKKFFLSFTLLSSVYILSSCKGNSSSTTASTDSSSVSSTTNMDSSMSGAAKDSMNTNNAGKSMVDQNVMDFAKKAATGGMEEVEMGKMAQQKAMSQKVKDFGKMMVDDHTLANNNFKTIATSKNIDLPATLTDDQKKDVDALSKKTGKDFDKAYVDMMISDHKEDISEFKDAQGKVADNDVKNFITSTLPTLQRHLEAIEAIKSKM